MTIFISKELEIDLFNIILSTDGETAVRPHTLNFKCRNYVNVFPVAKYLVCLSNYFAEYFLILNSGLYYKLIIIPNFFFSEIIFLHD